MGCVHSADFTWNVGGGIGAVADAKAECNGVCDAAPPAAPDGATASTTDTGLAVGTIATYSCTSGAEAKAICDAATLAWNPTNIAADFCSGAAPGGGGAILLKPIIMFDTIFGGTRHPRPRNSQNLLSRKSGISPALSGLNSGNFL